MYTPWSPKNSSEWDEFAESFITGKFDIDPPFRDILCSGLARANIYEELKTTPSYLDRVILIKNCFPYIEFQKSLQWMDKVFVKNSMMLNLLQDKGDTLSELGNLKNALRCYNLAISFAPIMNGSVTIVGVCMKRSSVFFTLKEYDIALKDIELALHHNNCPKQLEFELAEREQTYKSLTNLKQNEGENILRQNFKNEIISKVFCKNIPPAMPMADFISVEVDDDKGRHLIVNDNIMPGTTVIVEEPYVSVMVNLCKLERNFCYSCYKKVQNPIPCKNCVFVTYCGEKCRLEDLKNGHRYECPLYPYLYCIMISRNLHLSLKAICKAGPTILKKLYMISKSPGHNDYFWNLPIIDNNSYNYNQILKLTFHDCFRDSPFTEWLAISLAHLLRLRTKFFDDMEESVKIDFEDFVASMIIRHSESFPYNTTGISPDIEITDIESYFQINHQKSMNTIHIAYGIYPIINLMNHSCTPSSFKQQLSKGKMAIITNQQIKSGEELSHCYGYDFLKNEMNERQAGLLNYFHFKCECIACIEQWPMLNDLPIKLKFLCPICKEEPEDEEHDDPFYKIPSLKDIGNNIGTCGQCHVKFKINTMKLEAEKYENILKNASGLVFQNKPLEAIPQLIETIIYFQNKTCQPSIQMSIAQTRLSESYDLILNNNTNINICTSSPEQVENIPCKRSCLIL